MDIAWLEEHVILHPDSPLFARLAAEYSARGRNEEAINLCRNGLVHLPDYATGHLVLAKCYARETHYALALASLADAKAYAGNFPGFQPLFDEWSQRASASPEAPAPAGQDAPSAEVTEVLPPPEAEQEGGFAPPSVETAPEYLPPPEVDSTADVAPPLTELVEPATAPVETTIPDLPLPAETATPDVTPAAETAVPDFPPPAEAAVPDPTPTAETAVPDLPPPAETAAPDLTPAAETAVPDFSPPIEVTSPALPPQPEATLPPPSRASEVSISSEELAQIQRPAPTDDEEGRIISKTLAEIFASQGEFDEAIVTYRLLLQMRPELSDEILRRIDELCRAREEKLAQQSPPSPPPPQE